MSVEHVRVCVIRPKDVLCDARGDAIGTVTVITHPSPVDYDKTSEFTLFTLRLADGFFGGHQDFTLPAGVRVWRQRHAEADQ